MDIAAWLRELGLERYEQAFRESAIDTDILADLTETDLEELGISLSHRKKAPQSDRRAGSALGR